PPNRTCRVSPHPALQWLPFMGPSLLGTPPRRSSGVDGVVAVFADDQGLPLPGGHDLYPGRAFLLASDLEVGEFPYMMRLDVLPGAAEFAFVREEALDQLIAAVDAILSFREVFDDHERLGSQRETAERCNEWWFVRPLDNHLEARLEPPLGDG